MELKELKALKNGTIPTEQPSILDKMVPAGEVLGSTIGKSTLADRKAIHNLPKFENGKGNPFANAALNVMGNILQNRSNIFKTIGGALGGAAKAVGGVIGGAVKGIGGAIGTISDFSEKPNKTFGTNGNAVLSAATGAIGLTTGIIDAHQFNTTADDALQDAGTSEGNIGGVTYERLNAVNASQISEQTAAENKANTIGLMGNGATTGAAIGSVIPGVGTLLGGAVGAIGGLVGGLFGAGSRKEKMERMLREARDKAYRKNDYARSGALTSAMQQQYAQQYGDTESQSLYGFVNGKQSFSAAGPTNGYNARVSNGEIIANKFTGEMFRVPGIPNNKDGKLAYIRPTDTIITNKYGLSDYVAETGDLEGGEAMMSSIMKTKGTKGYKCGKLPKFDNGKWGVPEWSNFMGNIVPLIATGVDYFKNEAQPTGKYTATHSNPNAGISRDMMLQRYYNPYSSYNDMWNMYAKNSYNTNNTGGLSSSQRNLLRTTNYANTLDQIAKINNYALEVNNRLLGENAQFIDNQGRFKTQLKQADDIKMYDSDVRARGAKYTGSSTLRAQAGNIWLNMFKGFSDLDYYNYMKRMFDEDRRQEDEDRKTKNKTATTKRKSMYPYKLPEVSKSIVYKNKPVVGADINPVIGNWNRFMNDSPQFVSPFITSLFK